MVDHAPCGRVQGGGKEISAENLARSLNVNLHMRRPSVLLPVVVAGWLILMGLPFDGGSVLQAQAPAAGVEVASSPTSAGGAASASGADEGRDWRQVLPGVTLGAQMRLRTERRHNFRFDDTQSGNDEGFLLSRFRLGLTWEPNDTVTGVVELQDARIFGETAISETRAPNIFADQLDFHQAYLDVRAPDAAPVPLAVRAGRIKLSYGAQRLISPLEWVNTARVFDGVELTLGEGGRTVSAFASRLVPVTPAGINDHRPTPNRMFNSQLHGIYAADDGLVPGAAMEAYWLLRREARMGDAVHTAGARVDAVFGPWRIDGEAAGQTGRYGGSPHRALMLHVGGSFTTALPGRPRIGAAFNAGSGDDDPGDGVHGTFDNLYPLNHVYYGYMDLFALQNLRNVEVSVETALPARSSLRVAWQNFTLAAPGTDAWYNAGAGIVHRAAGPDVSSDVGSEIDITLRVPLRQISLEVGYGRFIGGAYLRDADFKLRSADFFYLQTVVGF